MLILDRRIGVRRFDTPQIFHDDGIRLGDFRKVWAKACKKIGKPDAIVHDLPRSGAKHLINAGVDPHTVMQFTGHKTPSMLRRYHIIDVDDLRRAAEQAAAFSGPGGGKIRVLAENSDTSRTLEPISPEAAQSGSR